MAKKMWAGRFEKATDKEVNDYNSSLPFDCKMYSQDIEGSIAHSQMLAKQGVISERMPKTSRAVFFPSRKISRAVS